MADRVLVMYAGHKIEEGTLDEIADSARHPYTKGLLRSMPEIDDNPDDVRKPLPEIPGAVPDLLRHIEGCPFAPRCAFAFERCEQENPSLQRIAAAHDVACWWDVDEGAPRREP